MSAVCGVQGDAAADGLVGAGGVQSGLHEQLVGVLAERGDVAHARFDVGKGGRGQQRVDGGVLGADRAPAVAGAQLRVLDHLVELLELRGGHSRASEALVELLPPDEGAVLNDRLRRLAHENGFATEVVQVAPDTQTALALVSAEVGCHVTLASVARNPNDPHVAFVPLAEAPPDVDLRMAWRRDDRSPALRAVLQEALELGEAQTG